MNIKGKPRQRLLWIATISLAVVFLGDRILLSGMRAKNQALKRALTDEEVTLRSSVGIQKRRDVIETEQKKYAGYFLPAASDRDLVGRFLKETERLAQEAGVSIIDLTPDNQPSKGLEYKLYKAQLKAEATMEQLLNLLYKLQTSQLLIRLERFSITPKDEHANAVRLETTISMAVP